MLYHTWTFGLFFALGYSVFLLIRNTRLRVPWLLVLSYVFYAFACPWYLVLLLCATTVDYLAVLGMARTGWKRSFLAAAIVLNLGLLAFFKYAHFFSDILLPVGLSFFIFQSMTYSIDFYRGQVAEEPSFLRYAAFVSLFPQLLAGPIERARNILPQLRQPARITWQDAADGLSLFVVGLFKKVALADYLALYVNKVYDAPDAQNASALVVASAVFAWQIYFDFSGYTDMARGVARALGIRLMLNFDNPYLATGLGDFWRRWHISLSTWFRDYLYIPLGGNRHGELRTYVNMALTMVVSGLWHGATWTFGLWGALHALYRVFTRRLESSPFYTQRVPKFVKRLWVFALVTVAWIFFRAGSFGDACIIVRRIFSSGDWGDPGCPVLVLVLVGSVWLYQIVYQSRWEGLLRLAPVRLALVVLMLLYLVLMRPTETRQFIYFQF